jgi:uncharacterized protein with von Willebrand factor type A (vWA) domain
MKEIKSSFNSFFVNYSNKNWFLYKPGENASFIIFDEKDKQKLKTAVEKGLVRDDLAQFKHLKKEIIIDIQANFTLDFVFNHYTIKIVDLAQFKDNEPEAWDKPIEEVVVLSSKFLKIEIEKLIEKYK